MANHSPEDDNYVSKKTFETAVEGGKPDVPPEGTTESAKESAREGEETRNPARKTGGGSDSGKSK